MCVSPLCLTVLQEQSSSPAKTTRASGKCPRHHVLVLRDTLCLPLPGTSGQVPALPLGSGTACFERQCHGKQRKQEHMCPWALLAHLPGMGRSQSSVLVLLDPRDEKDAPCQPMLCRPDAHPLHRTTWEEKFKNCISS